MDLSKHRRRPSRRVAARFCARWVPPLGDVRGGAGGGGLRGGKVDWVGYLIECADGSRAFLFGKFV